MAETIPPTSLKRKASPEPDTNAIPSAKRKAAAPLDKDVVGETGQERSDEKPLTTRQSPGPKTRRRTSLSGPGMRDMDTEEKKRGKRLFGSLLHTLSQPASNTGQQRKRQEAERRSLEKAPKQRVEDDKRRLERLCKIQRIRETEQVRFHDEVNQRQTAKAHRLARFLRTKAEPSLYYLPWKLTPSQEATLDRQEQDAGKMGMSETQTISRPTGTSLGNTGQPSEPKPLEDTNKDKEAPLNTSHEKEHDEVGDEMVQDNEDSVLY